MKSMILYSTTEKPIEEHAMDYWPVRVSDAKGAVSVAWIRAEVVEADPAFALDMAKPRDGEIVLNSIPLTP